MKGMKIEIFYISASLPILEGMDKKRKKYYNIFIIVLLDWRTSHAAFHVWIYDSSKKYHLLRVFFI